MINKLESEYKIKINIILENDENVENYKDFEIPINSWDTSFYDYLIKINEEEIDRFRNSKRYERRI
jgi:hypothetical protein